MLYDDSDKLDLDKVVLEKRSHQRDLTAGCPGLLVGEKMSQALHSYSWYKGERQ